MKIAFLHLSDIHFQADTDPLLNRANQIAAALGSADAIVDACVVVATGDIAYAGKKSEFEIADRFFTSLRTELAKRYGTRNVKFAFVPGNHDCDFALDTQPRPALIEDVQQRLSDIKNDDSALRTLLTAQTEFFRFASRWMGFKAGDPWIFHEELLSFERFKVHAACYNTSYTSQLCEDQGALFFPIQLATPRLGAPDVSITIALLHHPYHWLESNNAVTLRKHLDSTSDFVLTGHQHAEASYQKKNMGGDEVTYFEGAALQDGDSTGGGFNLILSDLEQQKIRRLQFSWKKGAYELLQSCDWIPFPRKTTVLRFEPSAEHQQFLCDPGTGFTHPRKAVLTLEDIFVYPDMNKLSLGKNVAGRDIPEMVRSDDVADFLLRQDNLFISGDDQAGKTSLAKTLFAELLKAGFVPVLISGAELRSVREQTVIRTVNQSFSHQYSNESLDSYKRLELKQKVLLLDNWHGVNLNSQGKAILIELLAKLFGRIYVFSGEGFRIEEIARNAELANPLRAFQFCEIREFGHVLRARLVEKWQGLGRDYTWDVNAHAHETHETEKLLATLLGKNLIPSYPVNILGILQAFEARRSASTPSGSYGYLYEALLTIALSKVAKDGTELDLMYTFIARLAFYLFSTERKLLTKADVERVSHEYYQEYSISVDVSDYLERLESAQVLLKVNGNFDFRYKYVYYYFVARYFQDVLRESPTSPEIRQKLNVMADQVYYEDYLGILMFVLYLTKDAELINHIVSNANAIYGGQEPCDFDGHIQFINRLYKSSPNVLIPGSDLESNREEYRKKLDEAREADRFLQVQNEKLAYSEELNDVVKLNIAFKTLQLLGQVLRNFPGSLHKNIKVDIARACYFLGLRVTRAIMKIAENNLEQFRSYVAEIIKDHRPSLTDGELAKTADEAVIWLTRRAAFGMIKRVSYAVGLELLEETYKSILESSHHEVSIRLIDMSLKLDHFTGFPEGEIDELWDELRKNDFCQMIIRDIYLFGLDYRILQRLGAKLDIKVSDPRYRDQRMKKLTK